MSTFVDRKAKTFFTVLDARHRGEITSDDYAGVAAAMTDIGRLDAVRAKQCNRKWHQIWLDVFGEEAKKGRVTLEVFRRACKNFGIPKMTRLCNEIFAAIFDVIDVRGEGSIRREEFELFQRIFRMDGKAAAESFEQLDLDHDGLLRADEFITAGILYFTSDDESSQHKFFFGPLLEL